MTKQITNALKILISALALSFGLSYAYAWTAPTSVPPAGNVSAPLNTSATEQTKVGGLTVDAATSTKDIVVNGVTVGQGSGSPSFSTAIGLRALKANLTGKYNTATGVSALEANTGGWYNTANGYYALPLNNGSYNTAVGTQALNANGSGDNNTAVGWHSLAANSTGYTNTANGASALQDSGGVQFATSLISGVVYTINSIGTTNFMLVGAFSNTVGAVFTATGPGSGNGTATANVKTNSAFGYNSGGGIISGSGNSIFGANVTALPSNLTNNIILANGTGAIKAQHDGTKWTMQGDIIANGVTLGTGNGNVVTNTALGSGALASSTYGSNTAVGYNALKNGGLAAEANTAIGSSALANTTGAYNTAAGYAALMSNTAGFYNTASGHSSLINNVTGNYNTAIGFQALRDNASNGNTAVGFQSLASNNTGSNTIPN